MPGHGVDTWEVVSSLATCFGGVAAAASAWFARDAARAAQTTSRDAMEALAVGIEPELWVEVVQEPREPGAPMPGPTRMSLHVRNSGRWPASDLKIVSTFDDGERRSEQTDLLDTMSNEGDLSFALRDVTPDWPAQEWEPVTYRIRFSDARGIARYEHTQTVRLRAGQLANGAIQTDSGDVTRRRVR